MKQSHTIYWMIFCHSGHQVEQYWIGRHLVYQKQGVRAPPLVVFRKSIVYRDGVNILSITGNIFIQGVTRLQDTKLTVLIILSIKSPVCLCSVTTMCNGIMG